MSTWRGKDDPDLDYAVQGWSRRCNIPTDWEGWEPHGPDDTPPPPGGGWFAIAAVNEVYYTGGDPKYAILSAPGASGYQVQVKDHPAFPTKLKNKNGTTLADHAAYLAGRPWVTPPFSEDVNVPTSGRALVNDSGGGGAE